jgi:glycosyl transferase family 25
MLDVISQNRCLMDYSFIHNGDLNTISEDRLETYFAGELSSLSPAVSCTYKHILAYFEKLNESQDEYALVLEDDIFLSTDFSSSLNNVLTEIKQRNLERFIISLEDSNLKYVKGSDRKKNVLLYKEPKGRMAGAYLIDTKAATSMLNEIKLNKCNFPIDWFHNYCSEKGLITIYWVHPALASQGSLNGKIESLLVNRPLGLFKIWKYNISRNYKQLLYKMR